MPLTAKPAAHAARATAPQRHLLLLLVSLLLNFLALIVLLRRADGITALFSQRIFFEDAWYSAPPVAAAAAAASTLKPCAPQHATHPPAADPDPGNGNGNGTTPILPNPWRALTAPELAALTAWLSAPARALNLTPAAHSRAADNTIFLIEAHPPPKAAALAFLAGAAPAPERFARVTLHLGARAVPVVRDCLVGPLPVGRATRMRRLTEIYNGLDAGAGGDVPYNARGVVRLDELGAVLARLNAPIADIMQELFGASARGLPNDTLVGGMSGPFSFDGGFRRQWMSWRRNTAGSFLLPVGFYQYLDTSGTDPAQWKILKHMYHDQVFPTLASFVEAFHNGTLIRHPPAGAPPPDVPSTDRTHVPSTDRTHGPLPAPPDVSWTERTRRGPPRDLDELPGPRSVSFAGLRYRVDRAAQHVRWMGWALYLGFERDMGLGLWDVRFRGERILYQLAPQEALAQYGGNDPMQSTTAWLDRYFGMGALVRNMLPHYDCPPEATFLPALTYTPLGALRVERAVCVFEQDTGRPLARHFGYERGEFGAVKGYVLTVRSTTTVGKWFDYMFYLDGTIEVRLSASGYMQGGYWSPAQDAYGARIHETSMGNLHDHVVNYKVDLDIAGTANSLLKTTTAQERVTHAWLDDDWGREVVQQRITREYIESEDGARLRHPPNFQGGYAVVNREARNRWGYPRGYAIHPGYNPVHNTVVGSKRLLHNADWARYNLAVSLRKETEPAASSMWNQHLPGAPPVAFARFFDGENITQRDLVAWVNVGMHHLPQAEDAPMTKTNIATSSFVLAPLNYFDYDVSLELQNAVLMHPPTEPRAPYTFDDYGVRQDFTCVPEAPAPFEYGHSAEGVFGFAEGAEARRAAEGYMRMRVGE